MATGRHSFVAFYPSDWMGGTARLPRLHRSVLFDVCCYIWDLAAPMPERELALMIADLPNGGEIVDDLIAIGKLVRDGGTIINPKALHEALKAKAAWERMSQGGRDARSKGDGKDHSKGSRENQNQNQNQNQKKKIPTASSSVDDERDSIGIEKIASVWNAMAAESGLKAVRAVTPQREANAAVLLSGAKIEDIVGTIETIPESKFLTGGGDRGWKISFDWLLCPTNFALVAEGMYHTDAELKVWTQADVDEWNRRSEKIGSAVRWRLKGTKIAPLAAA